MIKPAPRPHTRAASLPGQEHGQRGPRRAPGRRHRLGVERGDPRSTSPAWLLPRLPVHGPDQPAPHPHTPVGHDDRGFTIVYRSAHAMRVGAYCVIGPGAVGTGPRSVTEAAQRRSSGGARGVAPGCGTVAELGSGVMVLDQPR